MHTKDPPIVHRDIKPANVLMISKKKMELKLTDFGFSKCIEDGKMHEVMGSPYYMSPEVIDKRELTTQTDVWSVGVVLFYIATGDMPFNANNRDSLFEKIRGDEPQFKPLQWKNISQSCQDFIKDCLTKDPKIRPTADQLLNEYDWLKDDNKHELCQDCIKRISKNFTVFGHANSF